MSAVNLPSTQEAQTWITECRDQAAFLDVGSEADLERALDLTKQIKIAGKKVESLRDFFAKPLKDQVKAISGLFNPLIMEIDSLERELKAKMVGYQERKQTEARRLEALAMAEHVASLPAGVDLDQDAPPPATALAVTATARSWGGAVGSYTTKKKGRVIDFSALPDEYKIANESLINKSIQAGREIPGVEVYVETNIAIR